jgi:hypothetical protein
MPRPASNPHSTLHQPPACRRGGLIEDELYSLEYTLRKIMDREKSEPALDLALTIKG